MFHLKKPRLHKCAKDGIAPGSNPFDSDEESKKKTHQPPSEPMLHGRDSRNKLLEDDNKSKPSSHSVFSSARSRHKNDFANSGGLENQSVQDLENYAEYKAEETTKRLNSCLKIAENMRDGATKTLVVLHDQGDQITRAHGVTPDIDYDLSRGEKLLRSFGGFFSKKWKRTKTHKISGPVMTRDKKRSKVEHLKQREKHGLIGAGKGKLNARTTYPEPTDVYKKVEVEKAKQDDALSGLSNMLDDLKDMALDIGYELDSSRGALDLDPFLDDVDKLNSRMNDARRRGRQLMRE